MDCLSCNLPKYYILQVQEGTRCISYHKSAIVCIFLADAAEETWSIMRKFEGLIPKCRTIDWTITSFQMTELSKGSSDITMKMVANES